MASSDMVNSLLKALDILNVVANAANGIRLNELADGFGMKKTTVHNLVRTLRARNYLVKDGANRFHLGPAVRELLRAQQSHSVMREAETMMRELNKLWPKATLTFSENCNGEIYCRLRMSADQPGFIQRPATQGLAPYISASSLALMACNSDYRSEVAERFPFESYAMRRWSERRLLEEELELIRNRGFSLVPHEDRSCSMAIAAGERFTVGVHLSLADDDVIAAVGAALVRGVAAIGADAE